jgi:hypothetical protein
MVYTSIIHHIVYLRDIINIYNTSELTPYRPLRAERFFIDPRYEWSILLGVQIFKPCQADFLLVRKKSARGKLWQNPRDEL